MRISDWSSDVCSSDLACEGPARMGITTAILDSTVAPAAAAKKAFAPSKAKRERAIQKLRAQIAEKACDDAPNSGGTDEAKAHRAVEMVAVYDHPRLLRRSEEHTSELQSLMRLSYAV